MIRRVRSITKHRNSADGNEKMSKTGAEGIALLAIDLQNDFLADKGRMPVARNQVAGLLSAANRLLVFAGEMRWPVAYVVNEFSPWDFPANLFRRHAAISGRLGSGIDPRVVMVEGPRFAKTKGDAFSNSDLTAFLKSRGIARVILTGVFAEGCIWRTALGALRQGFAPVVVADAVASASDMRRSTALEKMRPRGIAIVSADDLTRQFQSG